MTWRAKNSEFSRLSTFKNFDIAMLYRNICPSFLARSGFSYYQDIDKIVCFSCNLGLDYRQKNFDADRLHRQHAKRCRLIKGLDAGNVPMTPLSSELCGGFFESDGDTTNASRSLYHSVYTRATVKGLFDENVNWSNVGSAVNPLPVRSQSDDDHESKHRLQVHSSVRTDPDNSAIGYDLRATVNENLEQNPAESIPSVFDASSGIPRTVEPNNYQSRFALRDVSSSTSNTIELEPRQIRSQTGQSQQLLTASNGPQPLMGSDDQQLTSTSENRPSSSDGSASQSSIAVRLSARSRTVPCNTISFRNPSYVRVEARMQTFLDHPLGVNPQLHRALAKAGFFHTGDDHISLRCFFCDGGFAGGQWSVGDDPWREHAREFPACLYIQMTNHEDVEIIEDDVENILESEQSEDDQTDPDDEHSEDDPQSFESNTASGRDDVCESLRAANAKMRFLDRCTAPGCNNPRNSVYLNCGHMINCRSCSRSVWDNDNRCPVCRNHIVNCLDVYQ